MPPLTRSVAYLPLLNAWVKGLEEVVEPTNDAVPPLPEQVVSNPYPAERPRVQRDLSSKRRRH